jgi:predicted dehydrogenase
MPDMNRSDMNTPERINVAVLGVGYWGPNLARNFAAAPGARLHTLCDMRREPLEKLGAQYPDARLSTDVQAVLADPDIDAVVIATPVHTHYRLAEDALKAGKHVLVEKPMAQSAAECRALMHLAESQSLVLMVGHVFLYNAAVQKIKEYIDSGELGDIYYIYSQRLNFGIIRQDVNALWNFAPHDLSILDYWLGSPAKRVAAFGYSYVQPGIEDVVFMTLEYPNGVSANVHISWLDPNKVRRMTVVGSRKMIVYDDVNASARLMVFDKGVERQPLADASLGAYQNYGDFQLLLRAGDVHMPMLDFVEPLQVECRHFIECIRSGATPLSGAANGLAVVQALEAADRSMRLARPVPVDAEMGAAMDADAEAQQGKSESATHRA